MKFFYNLWTGGPSYGSRQSSVGLLEPEDETLTTADSVSSRRRSRAGDERRMARERAVLENEEKDRKREKEQTGWMLRIAENLRLPAKSLADDIDDAIKTFRALQDKAAIDLERARQELEAVQTNAITLPDGRRVYFARDGQTLYAEDGTRISDAAAIEEARRRKAQNPDATDFETYQERERRARESAERSRRIADALNRLDELKEKLRDGNLTAEELEEIRRETDEITRSLPPEAQDDYRRIKAARESGGGIIARETDEVLVGAPDVNAHFEKSAKAFERATTAEPNAKPAYRSAPDF